MRPQKWKTDAVAPRVEILMTVVTWRRSQSKPMATEPRTEKMLSVARRRVSAIVGRWRDCAYEGR